MAFGWAWSEGGSVHKYSQAPIIITTFFLLHWLKKGWGALLWTESWLFLFFKLKYYSTIKVALRIVIPYAIFD